MCLDDVLCCACGACCTACCINANDRARQDVNHRRRPQKAKTNVVYVAPVTVTREPPRKFIRPSRRRSTYAHHPQCSNTA
ncbi:hypothetical protein PC129_g10574 [Phytophthora cactorum]|uniref:Uncharacterized protein n=1 Tax=Phytophthora cactorum TaxID=29920 RepID=A0A8T1KGV7_9STRA|nr:hypothetical protein Pcac1_g22931 [Phytophthora cactorum]KAG2814201.1 hypothetical protein PC111_g14076 [Phytophthora cactorum]KAG2819886.1 hypothetical protein PC112_g12003 [Phytophthora cactorum]KAG2901647.1 hypothetical protein PC114_g13095 [Phytophthora cactorum]KAG2917292.1 hypothetical protein PC115_g10762 [Phytophthora cactorum]